MKYAYERRHRHRRRIVSFQQNEQLMHTRDSWMLDYFLFFSFCGCANILQNRSAR